MRTRLSAPLAMEGERREVTEFAACSKYTNGLLLLRSTRLTCIREMQPDEMRPRAFAMHPDAASARAMRRTRTIRRALLRDCRCATAREAGIIIPSSPHMHKPPLHCAQWHSSMPSSHDHVSTSPSPNCYPDVFTYPGTHVYHAGNMCLYE